MGEEQDKSVTEKVTLSGAQLVEYVKNIIAAGNVRRLIIRKADDEILLEIPLTAGVVAGGALTAMAPVLAALGAMAALRRGSGYDYAAIGFATVGISIPNFVMGPLLILIFSFVLGWLPVSGRDGAGALVLPALTLGSALAAVLARMLRSTLLEVLGEDVQHFGFLEQGLGSLPDRRGRVREQLLLGVHRVVGQIVQPQEKLGRHW